MQGTLQEYSHDLKYSKRQRPVDRVAARRDKMARLSPNFVIPRLADVLGISRLAISRLVDV